MEVCPYSYFWCRECFWGSWISFVMTDEFLVRQQWGSQKLLQGLVSHGFIAYLSVFNLFLTKWIMAILSKGCKSYNFEPHKSLKLSFTDIWGLCSNFVECESFLESNSPGIVTLYESNLDDSIDTGNFSVVIFRGYLFLTWNVSITHMHGLAVYVKEELPFAWDLSLESSAGSYLCFRLALLYSVSYFFPLYWSPSSLLYTGFDSVSSNIEKVLSV